MVASRFLFKFIIAVIITNSFIVSANILSKPRLARNIGNHVQMLRELKTRCRNKQHITQTTGKSITESYLSIGELKKQVEDNWKTQLEQHPGFVENIIKQEKDFSHTHYVFYHAQHSTLRLLSNVINRIYNSLHIEEERRDFNFLRIWYEGLESAQAHALLEEEEQKSVPFAGHWDQNQDVAKKLLSVNLSLFGNCTWTWAGECTFHYFVENYSINPPDIESIIQKFLTSLTMPKELQEQLTALLKSGIYNEIFDASGLLMQIFIPKEHVDNYVYLCRPGGRPYERTICSDCFDDAKKRHTKISPVLDKYLNDPASIYHIDKLQARIILSRDMVLNPNSDVKIYQYSWAQEENITQLEQQLDALVQKFLAAWLDTNSHADHPLIKNNLINQSPLGKLFKYINQGTNPTTFNLKSWFRQIRKKKNGKI